MKKSGLELNIETDKPYDRTIFLPLYRVAHRLENIFPKITYSFYDYGTDVGYELKGGYKKQEIFYIKYKERGRFVDPEHILNRRVFWFKTLDMDREIAFVLVELAHRIDDIKRCKF